MIKFFRHIRKSLLEKNKMGKYFKYAIGEIVLVVIGILIALQINNWNDVRNKENKTITLLKDVLAELERNIEISVEKLHYFHEKDSVFYAIMFKEVTKETYLSKKFPEFKYMLNDSRKIELTQESFNALVNNIEDVPLRYKTIIKDLSRLYNVHKKEVDQWNETFKKEFQDYVKYESENYDWFSNYSESGNEPIIDYYLNSAVYKNKVAYMYDVVIQNLVGETLKYRKAAITNYLQIANLLELNIPSKTMVWQIDDPEYYTGVYRLEFHIKNGFIWGAKKPAKQVTIRENKQRLFMTSSLDTLKSEVLPFSKTHFFVNSKGYFTFKFSEKDTLIETNNGTVYRKINSTK